MKANELMMMGAAVVVVGGLVYFATRGVRGVSQDVARGAVDATVGATTGIVQGVSAAAGIPNVDTDRCERALKDNKWWEASWYCPADRFIGAVFE
jgi:hypothetical protein